MLYKFLRNFYAEKTFGEEKTPQNTLRAVHGDFDSASYQLDGIRGLGGLGERQRVRGSMSKGNWNKCKKNCQIWFLEN